MEKLRESFQVSKADMIQIPLKESADKFTEDSSGKKYECISKYRMPVSRYDWKNINNRKYPKALWENVIKNQKNLWEGSVGLADHPDDDKDGSVKGIFGVWHNLGLKEGMTDTEKIVEADLYLVGPYGKLAEEVLAAGGKLGFSSSGFGELQEDKITVDPASYMIERISDWVLNPSQGVFGTKESSEKVKENTPKETSIMTEKIIAQKYSKLEERKFRKDVEEFLSEATKTVIPLDRLTELKEILTYFENDLASDLKEQVEKKIKETEIQISESIKNQIAIKEELGVDTVSEIKGGISKLVTDTQIFERQAKDWKMIAEGLQKKVQVLQGDLELRPTLEDIESIQKKVEFIQKIANQREKILSNRIVALKTSLKEQGDIEEKLTGELAEAYTKGKELKVKAVQYLEVIRNLQETVVQKDSLITEQTEDIEVMTEKYETPPKIGPSTSERMSEFIGFDEGDDIKSYYEDLLARHGDEFRYFEKRLLGCKTLQEAMRVYSKIMAEDYDQVAIAPEALPMEERQKLIEAATGSKIRTHRGLNLPEGWN
jgi:hypothetical protein